MTGTVQIKRGTRGVVFHPETWYRSEMHRLNLVVKETAPEGYDPVITSGCEGRHSDDPWSKHYTGWALDYGIHGLTEEDIINWVDQIKVALGDKYYVLLEGNHIHTHVV